MSRHKTHILFLFTLLTVPIFLFSFWLMTSTFSYDYSTHEMLLDSHVWSDFGAHISLIRSFSFGPNWTKILHGEAPESPLYPGEPIKYHFGFYALVGLLEKLGLPINWALNIPSIVGFALLLCMTLVMAICIFNSLSAGILAVIFILFNSTLTFIRYFETSGLSISSIRAIPNIKQFLSFGPWDGGPITAFWTLNIYTNQRHLALSYALILGMLILLLLHTFPSSPRRVWFVSIGIAFLMSTLLFINQAAVLIALPFLLWLFIIRKETRVPLILAGLLSLPSFIMLMRYSHPTMNIQWKPGYVIPTPLTVQLFFHHWMYNLGLHFFFIPLGIILSPRRIKVYLLVPLMTLFIIPNLVQFSPDMINNHKFFNFLIIVGSVFTGYALVRIWEIRPLISKLIGRAIVIISFVVLTLSGILDFFVIVNDYTVRLGDIQGNPDVVWFEANTSPDDIILNSSWLYHPASIAGRFIYNGYPYFTWSYGYDKEKREKETINIYRSQNIEAACQLLTISNISYVELSDTPEEFLHPNNLLWENEFTPVYRNENSGMTVYDVRKSCNMLLQ